MNNQNETGSEENETGGHELFIRIAIHADSRVISEILLEAFLPFQHLYTEKAFAATTVSPDEVRNRMREGIVWVAIKNNRVVGTVAVKQKTRGLYIRGMVVLPEARGMKVGRRLLDHVEQYAMENKINRIFLSTTPYLVAAIHLYESFGFTQCSEVDDSFYGTPWFEMEKLMPCNESRI